MTDWIRALAASFAKRLVQEAAMTDFQGPNMSRAWLDEMGAKLDTIVGQERLNAQELIGRMCAAPLVIQYDERDELVHTDEHPFCDDPSCGCHHDIDLLKEQVFEPFFDGLLTAPEAHRFMEGKQL